MATRVNHAPFAERPCGGCGEVYIPVREKQKYCSANCKRRAWDKQQIVRTLVEALNRLLDELTE